MKRKVRRKIRKLIDKLGDYGVKVTSIDTTHKIIHDGTVYRGRFVEVQYECGRVKGSMVNGNCVPADTWAFNFDQSLIECLNAILTKYELQETIKV